MKKYFALALLSALILSAPTRADDTPSGVASDVGAVQKDNQAIGEQNSNLAKNRAAKAHDKATGNYAGQAVDSVKIGANKVGRSEKKSEKDTDKKIMNNDVDDAASK